MGTIENLIKEQTAEQIAKGAGIAVGWGIGELYDKNMEKKFETLKKNDFFQKQLISNIVEKRINNHMRWRIKDPDDKLVYFILLEKGKFCTLYDSQSYELATIKIIKTLFSGCKGFELFQGEKKIGDLTGKIRFSDNTRISFNGWQIQGNDNSCEIYDKNMKHIAQIRREYFKWVYKGRRRGGYAHSPSYAYALNYDDPINEIMCLMLLSAMHISL